MRQSLAKLEFHTTGCGLTEITREVGSWIGTTGIGTGLLTLNCLHTSASLLITENASDAVRRDLLRWLDALAPESAGYAHDDEGPDDMPAHLKSVLTNVSLSLPVSGGKLVLGTWQGIFLAEHRRQPHRRAIALHLLGE
jgi:secondary thiamine-phosphate synthase enzyme